MKIEDYYKTQLTQIRVKEYSNSIDGDKVSSDIVGDFLENSLNIKITDDYIIQNKKTGEAREIIFAKVRQKALNTRGFTEHLVTQVLSLIKK